MGRAHSLFGEPAVSGESPATAADRLSGAADVLGSGRRQASALSGRLAAGYEAFVAEAGRKLDGLAGADDQLGSRLRDAAASDGAGRNRSGRIANGAVVDTARMSPLTGTPAGQRALVSALRDRITEQQRVVAAYQARDARMASLLRTLAYRRGLGISGGGGSPSFGGGGVPFGGAASGGSLGSLGANMAGLGRSSGGMPAVQTVDHRLVPSAPAGSAVAAAMDKRGRPYVWGAKGPNVFDCSGLTQWAWRQAGVQLGGDTYAQIRDGVPVPRNEVRAGDLIFPTSSFGEGGQPGPGHVMLAISPTEVVHAPHTGDVVRVAPMPTGFVARRPVPLTLS